MARPKKKGLDYFPLDVDIFEDDKLFDVQNKYGPLGEIIYIRLLCLVYKNGYYYRFDNPDKLAALIIKSIGNRWVRDKKTVTDVISYLAECNLFSAELMSYNILTSRSIQMRYLTATERRQSHISEYNLLEDKEFQEGSFSASKSKVNAYNNEVNVFNNSENVSYNAAKKSKENKTKVNESKVLYRIPAINGYFEVTQELFDELTHTYPSTDIDSCLDKLAAYLSANPSKQRYINCTEGYIRMWIISDCERGTNKRKDSGYRATYSIEEFETEKGDEEEW